MIKIDWSGYFKDRIWFGNYWLPGVTMENRKKGFWYKSPVLRWYQIVAGRTGYNMYGKDWDR